ncbi:2-hydroxyacid dehydrogenase [Citricoccus sp.]|uniref:2-hydroxyacid dehydrogenase n=1 Tax=Citricoccus sp. TaxID=1978372 RepID=UPI00261D0AB9|nr:2-hydroxyacid dehydrogenase [Citricoccus sp.]HRO30674.1 2-hydroxyacid dehydrogenase [Citricoccus sp.]
MARPGPTPAGRLSVLVTDPIIARWSGVLTSGAPRHHWMFLTEADEDTQRQAAADCDVLVCSRLSAETAAGVGARLVQVTGAGLDRVAVDALPAGTEVTTTAHHERAIAEHVLMSVMALERRLLVRDRSLRAGTWRTLATDPTVPAFRTLDTLVLGAVGLGGIGAETLRLAESWGMATLAVRGTPDAPLPEGVCPRWVGGTGELPRLLAEADVVVVSVPLSPATQGMIGAAELTAMKPDAVLVNVARGPVVDQAALHAALTAPAGTPTAIGGAALDVWWGPPSPGRTPPAEHDFTALDNVVLTPHCSGHAESTFAGRARDIAANVERLAAGTPRLGVVRSGPRTR